MKLKISLIFLVIATGFVFLVFKGGYFKSAGSAKPNVGQKLSASEILQKISSLDLRDYKGDKITLQSDELTFAEKVVVHLWASWCGPCVNEVPELIEYSKANPDVKFVIVSLDDYQDDINKFMKSFPEFNSKSFIKIWDGDKKISGFLDADRLPMSVLINRNKSEPQIIKAVVHWKTIQI